MQQAQESQPADTLINSRERKREIALRNLKLAKPFKPGQSGNPSGRPRKEITASDQAKKHVQKAFRALAEVLSDKDASPSARVAAASTIIDRAYGKAPQSVELSGSVSLGAAFEQLVADIQAERQRMEHAGELPVIDVEAEIAQIEAKSLKPKGD